jgi:hypothetical protein
LKVVKRSDVRKKLLPGRALQLVVGRDDAASASGALTMGFAHYSTESGRMEPHRHAEEVVLILGAKDGWARYGGVGDKPDEMCEPFPLVEGLVLHIPESEWHVFGFSDGGYVDIAFFYGQADVYSKQR